MNFKKIAEEIFVAEKTLLDSLSKKKLIDTLNNAKKYSESYMIKNPDKFKKLLTEAYQELGIEYKEPKEVIPLSEIMEDLSDVSAAGHAPNEQVSSLVSQIRKELLSSIGHASLIEEIIKEAALVEIVKNTWNSYSPEDFFKRMVVYVKNFKDRPGYDQKMFDELKDAIKEVSNNTVILIDNSVGTEKWVLKMPSKQLEEQI